jgi:hypothetical protein
MKKWLVGCFIVAGIFLTILSASWYFDCNNVLEHPKGTATVGIGEVYFDKSAKAVFVNASVWDAPFGVANFNYAIIRDTNDQIVVKDDTFNITVPQGQSGILRVNCNCTVLRGFEITIGDDYNWWSIPFTGDRLNRP